MEAKKRRTEWPVWLAIGISLTILYVLSLGPACWLVARGIRPFQTAKFVYTPLVRLIAVSPKAIHELVQRYCDSPSTVRYPFGVSRRDAPFLHIEYETGVEDQLRKERLSILRSPFIPDR